jgi:hypothetical protein
LLSPDALLSPPGILRLKIASLTGGKIWVIEFFIGWPPFQAFNTLLLNLVIFIEPLPASGNRSFAGPTRSHFCKSPLLLMGL